MASPKISPGQVRAIRSTAHGRLGWDEQQYHQWLRYFGGPESTLQLSRAQAANVLDTLMDLAAGRCVRVWHVDQITVLQRGRVDQAARLAGFDGIADQRLGGIVHQATHGRINSVLACTIHEGSKLVEALEAIARRRNRTVCQA